MLISCILIFFSFRVLNLNNAGDNAVEKERDAWIEVDRMISCHLSCLKCTGCPKTSFLCFISLYFSTIELGMQIISTKVVSFNIIHYFHTCCAIF